MKLPCKTHQAEEAKRGKLFQRVRPSSLDKVISRIEFSDENQIQKVF